jgi:hypothetical protein
VWQASGGLAALWPAYVTGCAAAFALLGALRARLVDPRRSRLLVTLGYTALGSLPAWPVLRLGGTAAVASWPLSAVATLTAVVLLVTFERTPARYLERPERWLFPGLLAAGAALVVLLVAGGIGKL